MGFFDKLKALFGFGASPPTASSSSPSSPASAAAASSQSSRGAGRGADGARAGPSPIASLDERAHRDRALARPAPGSPWAWRRDVIPPAVDERTALVDRGMVLRGLVDEGELAQLHALGDRLLAHTDAERLRQSTGHAAGQAAVDELRAARAAQKAEKRAAAEARRHARAEEQRARRATHIDFVGRGLSSRLAHTVAREDVLRAAGLPVLATAVDVAAFLDVPLPRLRWLAFHAVAAAQPHYAYFRVPKKSGGTRLLSAPMPLLAAAQERILRGILDHLAVDDVVHGFVRGRSVVTNAAPHLDRAVVVNVDLQDFFPSIGFARVRGVFEHVGYSGCAATLLAALCTEEPRVLVDVDGARRWVAVDGPALPQGACTSPALANQVARALDRRLVGFARAAGFSYTRYADDLTFSADEAQAAGVGGLLSAVERIAREEGFVVHPDKRRVLRRSTRQEVTGVVVQGPAPTISRAERRRLRAALHQQGQGRLPANETARLAGRLSWLRMVDPPRAAALLGEDVR